MGRSCMSRQLEWADEFKEPIQLQPEAATVLSDMIATAILSLKLEASMGKKKYF